MKLIYKFLLHNSLVMFNGKNNDYALAPRGYSYSLLFFIFSFPSLVPFFRKDYKTFVLLIVLAFLAVTLSAFIKSLALIIIIIYYVYLFYLSFSYNKKYIINLNKQSYNVIMKKANSLYVDNINVDNDNFIIDNFTKEQIENLMLTNGEHDNSQNHQILNYLVKKYIKQMLFSILLFCGYIICFALLQYILLTNKIILQI